MTSKFTEIRPVSPAAQAILRKRYFLPGETNWNQVADRSVDFVVPASHPKRELIREMIRHRYFLPNSPCLANAGKQKAGLLACFVAPMYDSIEEIYQTKLDFALVAKRGGGCGVNISNIRPKGEMVEGSTHGYAGGGIAFFNTISQDMAVMTQGGLTK